VGKRGRVAGERVAGESSRISGYERGKVVMMVVWIR